MGSKQLGDGMPGKMFEVLVLLWDLRIIREKRQSEKGIRRSGDHDCVHDSSFAALLGAGQGKHARILVSFL